jgi:MinD-like ATPase involved in chromosome partitioning or flagellar assembly
MPSAPMVISFVSGKGGVGKTSLAANFAWVCGRIRKTILIDLDFQNQGATGLFLAHLPRDARGALDVLTGLNDFSHCVPIPVEDNVFFVPAVTLLSAAEYSKMSDLIRDSRLADRLDGFLAHLRQEFGFDVLVLDCHGGLDYVSMSAQALSDETMLVTEADTVTFNGTLELIDFYDAHGRSHEMAPALAFAGERAETPMKLTPQLAEQPPSAGKISLVVNRLAPKYRFGDLDSTYKRLLTNYRGTSGLQKSVLSFIPEETFIAESFGEYPFCVKLAPKSIIARKLQLMMVDLLKPEPITMASYPPLKKLRSERFRRKVRAATLSAESRNTNNIVYAFGWLCLFFSITMIALISTSIWAAITQTSAPNRFGELVKTRVFGFSIVLALSTCMYYCIRAQLGLIFYYNEKYQFRRALQLATKARLSIWQMLSLVRLWSLRLAVAIGPLFVALFAGVYIVIGVLLILQKL